MDEQVKICPECGAEYFAHITACRGCEVALVSPGEKAARRPAASPEGSFVCIDEGEYERVQTLGSWLKPTEIEYKILKTSSAGSCSSPGGYGLFVPQSQARSAAKIIDDLWHKHHPEIRQTEERMSEGLCPACGADLKDASGPECPDCGLNLGGCSGNDDGCGSCGPSH